MHETSQQKDLPGTNLSALERLLGYRFRDPALLLQALTHRSYVSDHEGEGIRHNEALEFLGDAVLGFLVSSFVFERFPECSEGEMSKIRAHLVSAANLHRLAGQIRLGDFLRLSRGEEKTGGRSKRAILVDACEAVIGALFLDGGIEAASAFILRHSEDFLHSLDLRHIIFGDFKSALQERLHSLGRPQPAYRVVAETGPDHRKTFLVQVRVRDEVVAEASGATKKEAQQAAARIALESLPAAPLGAGDGADEGRRPPDQAAPDA
jgi:ribonuclease-3